MGISLLSIQLEFERFFAKVALLLNGSCFVGIDFLYGNQNTGMNPSSNKARLIDPSRCQTLEKKLPSFIWNSNKDSAVGFNLF